jgi:4-aminobutyrate aminotransferase-like enzyme
VLQVIRTEGLLENARRSGEHLLNGLRALARRCAVIRDVRGAGLFIGVELGANPASGLAGSREVKRVVNEMRTRGVLLGTTGRNGDVLKIRPPLTFALEHAELLLGVLEKTLQGGNASAGGGADDIPSAV